MAKVALRFGCAKQSKNIKRYLIPTYLFQIPGADTAAIAAIAVADQTNGGRICGRVLASITAAESDDVIAGVGTVCGK